jgi:hypothetical protein
MPPEFFRTFSQPHTIYNTYIESHNILNSFKCMTGIGLVTQRHDYKHLRINRQPRMLHKLVGYWALLEYHETNLLCLSLMLHPSTSPYVDNVR